MSASGLLSALVFSSAFTAAEMRMPEQPFRMPVDLPMDLSGNFGQLRSTHFHAGLDIRTRQTIGHKIYAAADGYVSRIRVNVYSYGKVVYINHPGGKTTVYAHLDRFSPELEEALKAEWERTRSYEVDIVPAPRQFPVKQGQLIGFSGNTGASGGPHLHFEVRDTRTEEALNPLKHGYKIADAKKPVFTGFRIYSLEGAGLLKGIPPFSEIALTGADGHYKTKAPSVSVSGRVGVGLNAYDPLDLNSFRMGIYKMSVYLNDSLIYGYVMDRFSFPEGKRITVHCDYEDKISSNDAFEKLWVQPGNDSRLYTKGPGSGVFELKPDEKAHLRVVAEDVNGNTSRLTVHLIGASAAKTDYKPTGRIFSFLSEQTESLSGPDFRLLLPPGILFDDVEIPYSEISSVSPPAMREWQLGFSRQHLKGEAEISLSVAAVPALLRSKLYVLHEGKKVVPVSLDGDFVKFSFMRLGRFALAADTTAPVLAPLQNFSVPVSPAQMRLLRFRVSDSQTGVASWEAYLNDRFLLLEYEYKENLFFARDPAVKPGLNTIRVKVRDVVGNETSFEGTFTLVSG